jgi:hypothetical protein
VGLRALAAALSRTRSTGNIMVDGLSSTICLQYSGYDVAGIGVRERRKPHSYYGK